MRTSSESDSGFTADRAIGSERSSVAPVVVEQPARVTPFGRDAVTRRARSEAELEANALTATAADNRDRSAGTFASSPTYRPVSSFSAKVPADLHGLVAVTVSSLDASPGHTDPASSLAAINHFKDCARLASLADGANGALNLRAPSLNSVGDPYGLVMLPAPESGVAHSCSSVRFFSDTVLGRSAVTRQGAALAASPQGLTATAADNQNRSAGSFAFSPTYSPVSSVSARLPAHLRAAVSVTVSSLDASRRTTDPVSSLPPRATHSHLPTYLPVRWARRSGEEAITSAGAPA